MKNIFLLAVLAIVICSCSSNKKQSESQVFELDQLLVVADQELDKTVTVVGYVTHTCKHSGKRCFIIGESQKATMRVEATGDISGFSSELVGSKLAITGALKELRLSEEYISGWEKDVNHRIDEDGSVESCAAELSNIKDMRNWMEEHHKDYYVIYYMDGLSFDVLD